MTTVDENTFFFKENFTISMNSDKDPVFIMFDYGVRSYEVNMELQHFHNFYEIFIALEPGTAHLLDGKYYKINKNDMVFIKPELHHMSVYPKDVGISGRIIINFNLNARIPGLEYQMAKLFKVFNLDVPIMRFPNDKLSKIIRKLNEIFITGMEKQNGWQIGIYSLFLEFLWAIALDQNENRYTTEEITNSIEQKIYTVNAYINDHYQEELSLPSLAEKFAISQFYLSHQFKNVNGCSLISYIQKVRICHAARKLAYSQEWIKNIIEESGFSSSSQFNRVFSKFIGMSPTDFRNYPPDKRKTILDSLDPESTEKDPALFSPRKKKEKSRIKGVRHMKIGMRAHDFGPMTPEQLKALLEKYNIETIQLAIPKSFPELGCYSTITDENIALIKKQHFDISILGCYIDLACPNDEQWKRQLKEFENALRIASILKAGAVGTETSDCTEENRAKQFARVVEALEYLLPVAEQYGIPIAIEPVIRHTINTPNQMKRLMDLFKSEYLKTIFDPVNLLDDQGENNRFSFFENAISTYGDRIAAMHVKDTIHGDRQQLGKGIMAKTFPHIAEFLPYPVPAIREELPVIFLDKDLEYMRQTFR